MSVLNDMKSFKTSLLDIDVVEDNFQHWNIILNFLKRYLIESYKSCYWGGCLETFNYKIYRSQLTKPIIYMFFMLLVRNEKKLKYISINLNKIR